MKLTMCSFLYKGTGVSVYIRPLSRQIPPPAENGSRRRRKICGAPLSQPQLKNVAAICVVRWIFRQSDYGHTAQYTRTLGW